MINIKLNSKKKKSWHLPDDVMFSSLVKNFKSCSILFVLNFSNEIIIIINMNTIL